jgi:PAS domain S-box-containing protein
MTLAQDIRVLHIDDDPDFLEISERYVGENERLTVETETDPVAGLERISEFDCVVLDYKMSGMDGLSFLQELREEYQLPVIFFTGAGSEEVASEAIRLGVTDYIQKETNPTQFHILANRIKYLVDKERAERAAATADQRIREVYERITVAFFAVDDEWQFSYLNDHAEVLFETDETAVLEQRLWDVLPELQGSDTESHLRAAIDDQDPVTCEAELSSLDKHVELHAFPDKSGVSVFVEDITERRKREAELEELRSEPEITEEQFRTLRQIVSRPSSLFR